MSEYTVTAKCERCGNTESKSVCLDLYDVKEEQAKEMLSELLSAFRIRNTLENRFKLLCSDCEADYRRRRAVCSAIHDRMIESFWRPKGGE